MALHVCMGEAFYLASENNSAFRDWIDARYYSVHLGFQVFGALSWLVIAYFLSAARSIHCFATKAGLSRRPTLFGWWCAWGAIGIAFLDRYAGAKGLTSPNPVASGFYVHGGWHDLFYVFFVVSLGPFYEEVVLRGFLYSAFRRGYGWIASTLVVLCVTAYFHKGAVSGSFWTALCLGSLWVLFCQVRERTPSVWNCVLCHAAYNAVQVFAYPVWVAGMLFLLPVCAARKGKGPIPHGSVGENP
jgi:membrane protease YdiL (CAAX protease family)